VTSSHADAARDTQVLHFEIAPEHAGQRLDIFLADQDDPPLTRSQTRRCIERGEVTINGTLPAKTGVRLKAGDAIVWRHAPPEAPSLEAQDIPLSILAEDAHFAIVDKPHGMVVHPAPGHPDRTLVNAILFHFQSLASGTSGPHRPGIVHRIDKDTSGAIVVTKTDAMHRHLSNLFRAHDIERAYHALVFDQGLPDSGTFDTLHGRDPRDRFRFSSRVGRGRRAVTHFEVLERFAHQAALVACRLETGRTHQIRMHFYEAECPLLGDQLYGGKAASRSRLITRQALHARTLGFPHIGDTEHVSVTAPYPEDFAAALDALRSGKPWR